MPDDKLLIAPCNDFIELTLVQKKDDNIICVEMDSILTSDSQFVLVEGHPGFGKSTLCWELCRKWDTLKSLKDYNIVLQLKLREWRVQNATSLNEIFYHDDKRLCDSVVDEVFKCDGEGVLLIFDGLDEMPTSVIRKKGDLIMRLINGKCLPRATRLVTSRPSALHHKNGCFPQVYRHVKILGFTNERIVRYAEKAFRSEPDVFTRFKNFIFSNPVINSLMYIPVNCAIIAQVYKEIGKSRKLMPKTITQLYTILIKVLIRRHMVESGEWDEHSRVPSNLKDLPDEVSTKLKKVSELAYRGLFMEEGVQLVFTDNDIGEGFQHLGLLSESKEMYVHEGARTSYSFLHLSIQEFLAAWHVSCHHELIDKVIPIMFSELEVVKPHLNTFGRFLAGLVGCDNYVRYWSNQSSIIQLMYYIHYFYEAQDSSKSKWTIDISDIVPLTLDNPLDMYVFGYTLVHVPVKWHLTVNISLDMLAYSLADHTPSGAEMLGSIVGLVLGGSIFSFSRKKYSLLLSIEVEQLPQFLRESIIKIDGEINSISYMCLPLFPNLQSFSLFVLEQCQDDYLLYQALNTISGLKELSLSFSYEGTTTKGIQELCDIIACSHSLECVTLTLVDNLYYIIPHNKSFVVVDYELQKLVQAVLSCSSVKSLATNFPFTTPISLIPRNIEDMSFQVSEPHGLSHVTTVPLVRLMNCLCCIANMCKIPSMRSLVIILNMDRFIPTKSFCNFLAILNASLYCNPAMERVIINYQILIDHNICIVSDLSHALCQGPGIPQLNLRRSMSLCDLTILVLDDDDYGAYNYDDDDDEPLQCSQSCPDLLEMQSLHSIHPLLYESIGCYQYYLEK